MSGSGHGPIARDSSGTASQKQASDAVDHETGEGSDAWEAAQNILKAINFGQLFQISNEENKAGEPSTSANSPNLQATVGGSDPSLSTSDAIVVEESTGARLDGAGKWTELNAEQRAALQAQLALLAAQLAELADVTEDELSYNLEISQRTADTSDAHATQVFGERSGLGDDNDNEDMVEISVPMASLSA